MISVLWCSRNDDHGGLLLPRIQAALDAWGWYRASGLDVEVVCVEWNPPGDAPRLRQALDVPKGLPVRWYEVPPEVHRLFPNWERFNLWNHIGTNVAARRARGDMVLATTHDVVLSVSLTAALKGERWADRVFYRAPRYDANACLEKGRRLGTGALLTVMAAHTIQRNDWSGNVPFTKSCGDFILMSRARWEWVRGYVEWPVNGIWLDGLLLFMCLAGGMSQAVFADPAWHMEHEGRGLSIYKGLPHLPRDAYKRLCFDMMLAKRPVKVNPPTWGLAELREVQVGDDAWVLDVLDGWVPPTLRWFD